MEKPREPPCRDTLDAWRAYALEYLSEQLGEAAPKTLSSPVLFDRSPLDGEGATLIFDFTAAPGGGEATRFYVAVGRTEPNYYLAYGLDADEAFSLHVGTRFMLVMGVAQRTIGAVDDYDPVQDARTIVDRVAPNRTVSDVQVAATFDVDGQMHAVLRCRIDNEEIYVMGREAPPGFSTRVDLAPQVVYRLHLGTVLRREPEPKE